MNNRLQLLLTEVIQQHEKTQSLLEKIASLLISQQLLQECVDHAGQNRTAEEVASLVTESYSAGRCLLEELDQRNREFDYQKSEFFIDEPESTGGETSLGSF